ncbi:unnamed protein product [Protopolystoma xenopodis]|uniref:Uncharacterized protein n=1 Tax=Protopolystoma xenopodis TaxID=117903 RepID=A0A3S5CI06_9PLAT|nr:unnamed protein product [Protopolystoma xenopodis]
MGWKIVRAVDSASGAGLSVRGLLPPSDRSQPSRCASLIRSHLTSRKEIASKLAFAKKCRILSKWPVLVASSVDGRKG